jgi:hypothetical protein
MARALYSTPPSRNRIVTELERFLWITCARLSLIMDEGRG